MSKSTRNTFKVFRTGMFLFFLVVSPLASGRRLRIEWWKEGGGRISRANNGEPPQGGTCEIYEAAAAAAAETAAAVFTCVGGGGGGGGTKERRGKSVSFSSLRPSVRLGFKSLSSSSLGTKQVLAATPLDEKEKIFPLFSLSLSSHFPLPPPRFVRSSARGAANRRSEGTFFPSFFFQRRRFRLFWWSKFASKTNPHLMGDRSMYGKLYFRNKKRVFSQIRK